MLCDFFDVINLILTFFTFWYSYFLCNFDLFNSFELFLDGVNLGLYCHTLTIIEVSYLCFTIFESDLPLSIPFPLEVFGFHLYSLFCKHDALAVAFTFSKV